MDAPTGTTLSASHCGHSLARVGLFYSFDCNEPTHVHVRGDCQHAKFWLAPVGLAFNHGFSARELHDIRRIIIEHGTAISGAWNEHCGQR
jgi:hypothetical protein